jgi:hypothetical protein
MRLLILIFTITLFGCQSQPKQEVKQLWFDLPGFVDELVLNMSAQNRPAAKFFLLNAEEEAKEYESSDSTFWAAELAKLEEIDLNSPQVRDIISIKRSIKDDKSNLLINEYLVAADNVNALKKLKIYYLTDTSDIRIIYAELNSNNFIEKSATKITLWLNSYNNQLLIDSLEVMVKDRTLMQSAREYKITTKTKW